MPSVLLRHRSWYKASNEKEDFRKVCLELSNRLSSLRLGQTNSSLSASAKPFVPLATSSITAMGVLPPGGTTLPLKVSTEATRPLYTTDDDGFTTDAASLKKKKNRRGQRGKNSGHHSATSDTGVSNSGSDTSSMTNGGRHGRKKKKAGVNNKVNIPEFGGKDAHPHNMASTFRSWARIVAHYRDYYEDGYLMTQVIASLKGDAAGVFDCVRHNHHDTSDLSLIMEKIRNHYCSTLTFREQRNTVENMRQASSEGAADFLVRVSNAVQTLNKDWKNHMTREEMDTLQYEVSLNGVDEEFQHVLDSEVAKYGELEPAQMYNAVKHHEAYLSQNKCLQNKGTYSNQAKAPQQTPWTTFKPRYHKTTAFAATTVEQPEMYSEPAGSDVEVNTEVEEVESISDEVGGTYLPEFLSESPIGGDWSINVKMANAIKANKQFKKCCFECKSPDHFIKDCPQAKNGQRPQKPMGPHKNHSASVNGKGKPPSSMHTLHLATN